MRASQRRYATLVDGLVGPPNHSLTHPGLCFVFCYSLPGFLASGMKRAYGIKDFDSLIPGHGGVMDRMDCQFLMALCTWVHYNTFVKLAMVSVPRLTYLYSLLGEHEKKEFLKSIAHTKAKVRFDDFT